MTVWLQFLIACHGIVQIVTGGRIFKPLREALLRVSATAGYWIKCPMCFGLPVGAGLAALGLWPHDFVSRWSGAAGVAINLFVAGVVSSGFCWTMHVILHALKADEL